MDRTPTQRQFAILNFIKSFIRSNHLPPTVREIAESIGISPPGALRQLRALEQKGLIRRGRHRSRSIEILGQDSKTPDDVRTIPVLGRISAGIPSLAEAQDEGSLVLGVKANASDELFALRVVGDSMTGAGILPGDLVIARRQPTAQNGDVVVATIEGEATVKRFRRTGRYCELQPENPAYSPIPLNREDAAIQGKVIAVHRELRK